MSLQIRAIAELLLWFAPNPGQKSIGLICSIKNEAAHQGTQSMFSGVNKSIANSFCCGPV
ncbi:hypothetical protein J2X19_002220 [Rhodoferax ferrireducens]|uniref:Uncharacterized protein n=1 Tax=Rhodoferax ferrireducens TaxID=192843 RepID=A0ABU2C872_9BURK|nr:hypothetical protein [Rhodoferax ferrireducens]